MRWNIELSCNTPLKNLLAFCSIDAVSDRDFVLEFLSANSITAIHLSRLGEEWVLWASEEFGFLTPSDKVSTGSSIMPQKKNPDPMELVRGKSARVVGSLTTLLVLCKGLPLAYNRDLQVRPSFPYNDPIIFFTRFFSHHFHVLFSLIKFSFFLSRKTRNLYLTVLELSPRCLK